MLSFLTSLVAPKHCLLCEGLLRPAEQSVCQICVDAQPRCSPIELERLKRVSNTANASFHAPLINTPSVSTLCHSMKYGGNLWLARQLGREIMGPSLKVINTQTVILIPMPISKKRLRTRGYNQSEQLAKGCLTFIKDHGINALILPVLEKIHDRKSQVEMSPFERWTNPRGSLRVSQKIKQRIPRDALLVLIDDTVTTGSTLICAAEVIRKEFPEQPLHLLALALEV